MLTRENLIYSIFAIALSNAACVDTAKTDVGSAHSSALTSLYEVLEDGRRIDNSRYDPENFGIAQPSDRLQYKFEALKEMHLQYADIDRKEILKELFEDITSNARSNTEKHEAVLGFLHKYSMHNSHWVPVDEKGVIVSDPLLLLALGESQCGNIARLVVDLFQANGYQARIVNLADHITSEVFYDESWHYFDADLFGGGQTVKINGVIPSIKTLSENPPLIDQYISYPEFTYHSPELLGSTFYASSRYFSKAWYDGIKRGPTNLNRRPDADFSDKHFGWRQRTLVPTEWSSSSDVVRQYRPSTARIVQVDKKGNSFNVRWIAANDEDGDLEDYKVYVSSASRGWHYPEYKLENGLSRYANIGWKPNMYDAMFKLPQGDVDAFTTKELKASIDTSDGDVCVVIFARDSYGIQNNIEWFSPSVEVCSNPSLFSK